MNLADLFSGGEDSAAQKTLQDELASVNAVSTPAASQLTLPQLQQYVSAGLLTPEQAQAYVSGPSAFSTTTADNTGMQDELSTLGELNNIINQGGNDAQEQADVQSVLNSLNTTESGNSAAITNQLASQGINNSGFKEAALLAGNQNQATNANANALAAAANAEQRQLTAINNAGTLGGAVQGQEYTQTANAANAADAIAKFNAQQDQADSQFNTTEANAAKSANLANAQNISNLNTQTAQTQEESVPAAQQQAFEDALQKAGVGVQAAENAANQETQTGQQNAGILGGGISALGTVGAAALTGNPYAELASAMSTPNANVSTAQNTNSATPAAATGGRITPMGVQRPVPHIGNSRPLNMKAGGPVPGEARVAGDSPLNDDVKANLSPDEIVLPRTVSIPAMQGDTSKVMDFLRSLPKPQSKPSIHPKAVLDTLRALNMHHTGAI